MARTMGSVRLNPFILVAGTIALPLVANAIGRGVFSEDPAAADADKESRRLQRNFALFNTAVAAGLGYAAARSEDERVQSAALGGAIGTAIVAGTLTTSLLSTPSQEELAERRRRAAGNQLAAANQLAASNLIRPAWTSNLIRG